MTIVLMRPRALDQEETTMKALPSVLSASLIAALALAGPVAPAAAGGMTTATCAGIPMIAAERPAGAVALPAVDASGYSPWTGRFRMGLNARGEFSFVCRVFSLQGPAILNFTQVDTTVTARCADRSNLLQARRAPNGVIEFRCIARDHRR